MSSQTYRSSYWERSSFLKAADFAIVGGGLTGLQTALALKREKPEAEIIVIERSPFGQGASTRNAGFSCFGAPTELIEDLALHGEAPTWETVALRYAGIVKLAKTYGRWVDYHNYGGYEVYDDDEQFEAVASALPKINRALAKITGHAEVWKVVNRAPGIKSACKLVYNPLEGQLHPGKLVMHLIRLCQRAGIRLLFGMNVEQLEEGIDHTRLLLENNQFLDCHQLILTTNAFTKDLLKTTQIQSVRNQVLISKPINGLELKACFHHERGYVYFRNVGSNRLLIGGARHLAGKISETTSFGDNPELEVALKRYVDSFVALPEGQNFEIDQSWSGIIAQGGKSPIIKKMSNGWVLAVRLSGMGVALSGQVAEEAAKLAVDY